MDFGFNGDEGLKVQDMGLEWRREAKKTNPIEQGRGVIKARGRFPPKDRKAASGG
jgi:hypothetical protein